MFMERCEGGFMTKRHCEMIFFDEGNDNGDT